MRAVKLDDLKTGMRSKLGRTNASAIRDSSPSVVAVRRAVRRCRSVLKSLATQFREAASPGGEYAS